MVTRFTLEGESADSLVEESGTGMQFTIAIHRQNQVDNNTVLRDKSTPAENVDD